MSRRLSVSTPATVVAVLALLVGAYLVRPVFHGLVMAFYRSPLVWLPPLVVIAVAVAVAILRAPRVGPAGRATDPREDPLPARRRLRPPREALDEIQENGPSTALLAVLSLVVVSFLLGAFLNGPLTARSVFANTRYQPIPGLPAGGTVRLVPQQVAVQTASSGFNSPIESLTDFHIVRTPEGLRWTSLKTPEGAVRTFTKKTGGIVALDAASTERRARATDAQLAVAPGLQVTDNLTWRLRKERFFADAAEPAAILDGRGRPLIMVPYVEYRGLLVRRPVLGGVFVVHPDGRIEDLQPEEARRRPEIASSGRLYPDLLARRVHDAYAYKNGILNYFFLHEDQTQVADTESNEQPYLIDFGRRGAKWVTVAEPYGRAFAVNAIFLTDAATGETQVWTVPENQSLSGNRRAIQTVRSATIPGVVFAGEESTGPGSGGRFRVVEPRPVFVRGRLVYLLSIIPESANSVSKSVVVDAASNKVVQVFDSDQDPTADDRTIAFLAGQDPAAVPRARGRESAQAPAPEGGQGAAATEDEDLERRLDALVRQQQRALDETEALRDSLRRARERPEE